MRHPSRQRSGRTILLAGVLVLGSVVALGVIGRLPRPIEGIFVAGPTLGEGRIVNAIALPDGRVLVGAEVDAGPDSRSRTYILGTRSGVFEPTADAPTTLALQSLALLQDGRVLFLGASSSDRSRTIARVYDPGSDRFESHGDTGSRTWPFMVTLPDGRVLIGGGEGTVEDSSVTASLFDPSTGTFEATGPMTRARGLGATATLMADGRVLVVGGGPAVGMSAEIYDPRTGTFTATGSTVVARGAFHAAALLPDGRVLLSGGLVPVADDPEAFPNVTATAEVYDPGAGTFSAVGSMAAPRFGHAAAILPDGTVLAVGGSRGPLTEQTPALIDAEIFDPAAAIFETTTSLLRPRLLPVAVPIDGRVLVAGHLDPAGDDVATGRSTEWYQ